MKSVRVHGVEIAYRVAGTGPPLVLVHAGLCDGRMWQPQIADLCDAFTVVAWDEPGAGGSGDLPLDFALADYAHCLSALIHELGLGPSHVAGLSWGGTIAIEFYRQHPDQVATLILADTYAGWAGSLPADEVAARRAGIRAMADARQLDPTVPGLFAAAPPGQFEQLLADMAADVRPASMLHAASLMADADLRAVLPTIAVPTLLLWGELDARAPVATVGRQFRVAIPDATSVVIPDCGHMSNLERVAEFNDAIRSFIAARPDRDR